MPDRSQVAPFVAALGLLGVTLLGAVPAHAADGVASAEAPLVQPSRLDLPKVRARASWSKARLQARWEATGLLVPSLLLTAPCPARQPTDFIQAVDQVIADCSRFVADNVPTRPGWRSGPVLGLSLSHKLLPIFFAGPDS